MKKISRKAMILSFVLCLSIILVVGYFLMPKSKVEKKETEKAQYQITLVAENQKIQSTYINSISSDKSSQQYTQCQIVLKKGTKIKGYTLSQNQTFSKYIQLKGPGEKEKLLKNFQQYVTHYAYSMLLVGDIQEKTNIKTKEKSYQIVNARITYNQIPIILLSNENSVCIRNQSKTKRKIVNYEEFVSALKDVKKRKQMISW